MSVNKYSNNGESNKWGWNMDGNKSPRHVETEIQNKM